MSIKEEWALTEESLQKFTGSMGQLLSMIRPQISARILDGPGWERLLERAGEVPGTFAAFPFGFEIPLHDPALRADFGVSLVGDSLTAAQYQERNRSGKADASTARLAWLLDKTDRKDSPLRRAAGRKMLLEYDIDPDPDGERPDPGVFLYPVDGMLAGGGGQLEELGTIHDALVHAGGWSPVAAERRHLERVYGILTPDTSLRAFGTFPSRRRTVRIAATGFRRSPNVSAYLRETGWPGNPSTVGELVSFFGDRKAFAYLGVHFDITADGVGPKLRLSFFAQEREWLKDIESWTAVIEGIGAQGCAVPRKLEELARWSTGSTMLFAPTGPMMLVRGIHHVKLMISGDRIEQVKAYVFFLMMRHLPNVGAARSQAEAGQTGTEAVRRHPR